MPHNFDVVCVGNAKIDTFLTLGKTDNHLRFQEDTNELCIKFGEKIEVDKAEVSLGGNASNVAVGLSRLGLSVGIVAEIGRDEFAQTIINKLNKEKIGTSNVQTTEGQKSSFSTIINFRGERTIFSEHVERKHDFNFSNIVTRWIYLTSIGNIWQNAYKKTVDFVKASNCKLAFNPGTLQINGDRRDIEEVLSASEIIFVNKEEAETILGLQHGEKEIDQLLKNLQKLGPKIVVITDGEKGSYAVDKDGQIFKKSVLKTEVVEKTGAGDAYSSGFLAAFVTGKTVSEAMDWGTNNSASVITKIGAQEGLLRKESMEK